MLGFVREAALEVGRWREAEPCLALTGGSPALVAVEAEENTGPCSVARRLLKTGLQLPAAFAPGPREPWPFGSQGLKGTRVRCAAGLAEQRLASYCNGGHQNYF